MRRARSGLGYALIMTWVSQHLATRHSTICVRQKCSFLSRPGKLWLKTILPLYLFPVRVAPLDMSTLLFRLVKLMIGCGRQIVEACEGENLGRAGRLHLWVGDHVFGRLLLWRCPCASLEPRYVIDLLRLYHLQQ